MQVHEAAAAELRWTAGLMWKWWAAASACLALPPSPTHNFAVAAPPQPTDLPLQGVPGVE